MDYGDGFVSKEHQELLRSVSESADPLSASPLQISITPRSPKSPKSSSSPRSLKNHDKHSHSPKDGRPKKGGYGGKGTWGGLLQTSDEGHDLDPNDSNYDSSEDCEGKNMRKAAEEEELFGEYKKKATVIIEEYFATDDVVSTANELREIGLPRYNFYFVKKLVSMAMDRHDKEKEMAAVLLSALYADVIDQSQIHRGFAKLVESADDLVVDIPDAIDVLALFVARAVVDDILPPAFLTKQSDSLPKQSKGIQVLRRAEKGYLAAPLHAEIIERRWGGSRNKTAEDVRVRINNLLVEYVVMSGDVKEACRCIKDLNVPFFHHEIIKRALVMAMERSSSIPHQEEDINGFQIRLIETYPTRWRAEDRLLHLLKAAAEEGLINSSQISKGFGRMIDGVEDLSLDIPNAQRILRGLISKAASEGWLSASSLRSLPFEQSVEASVARDFKIKAQFMIKEYFLSGDIEEVSRCLEAENSELNAIFVKRLITLAMDRKNREKEMTSMLLSSLCFPADDVVSGFVMLIESADDTALDIPIVVEDLAMFLARAVVDEVLAPQHLEEILISSSSSSSSIGSRVLQMAQSILKARLSGERILRCWGGGAGAVEEVKEKIGRLLEEYESGGDVREAWRCIKELGMPFFHHEVVKKALVRVIEKRNERVWRLLRECFGSGLITMYQMAKGFSRVGEGLDDLALDVPDAKKQFKCYMERAKIAGWLDPSFSIDLITNPQN